MGGWENWEIWESWEILTKLLTFSPSHFLTLTYLFDIQRIGCAAVKGRLSAFKRWPFSVRKTVFRSAVCRLLQSDRKVSARRKPDFSFLIVNF